MSAFHFYLTFNPYLNQGLEPGYTQAHEFFDYLKSELKKSPDGYAYWGKIIGQEREHAPNFDQIKEIMGKNAEINHSTHLYITDFQNIWVGKVSEVKEHIGKDFKTLEFYKDKNVEIWFKLTDFTLLTYGPEETAQKLSELYIHNPYNNLEIDGLSPFTTGVRYPCILQDLAEEPYFDQESESGPLALQYNPAVNHTASRQVLWNLHNYVFTEGVYNKIPHAAKVEIESAELDILERRHHNLPRIAFSYIKALEVVLNDLIIHHIKRKGFGEQFFVAYESMPPKLYFEDNRDGLIPISKFQKTYSMNQLIFFMERGNAKGGFAFKKAFADHKPFIQFMTKELPALAKENSLNEMRGIVAHNNADRILPQDAFAVRNLMLGLGCTGLILRAYQTFYHQALKGMSQVQNTYDDNVKLKKVA